MLEHVNPVSVAPKRVVVMGAAGFVGGVITKRMARDGVPILALGRKDVDLLEANAVEKLKKLLKPEDSFVAVSARVPVKNVEMLAENVIMARAMVQALAHAPVAHVVNISSDAIYGDSDAPLTEDSPAAPGSLHGAMHLARELMFRAEVKAPLATLRPSLLYGAGDPHNGYGPNRFRRQALKGETITLFGEGEERRDHVFIDDLAELAVQVLYRRSIGALNIACGEVRSFREIAQLAVRVSKKNSRVKGMPRTGPMPHNGYRPFDISAIRRAFPSFRFTPFEDAFARSFQGG